jgi:DNA polymerase III delta prime subunit
MNNMKQNIVPCIPWVEKYRPSLLNDVVLEPLNREIFENILEKNYFPNLLIYGSPGCGKTTICINLINEYQKRYDRVNKSNVIHLNASDERGIDIIRNQIHQFVKSKNLFETGLKFVILDEVDYMTKNAQQALKYILETSTYNVRFCLICNYITKIDESLKNEFFCIRFNQLPVNDISTFIKNIAVNENLRISDEVILTIQKNYHSDIRSMVNYIQLNENILNDNFKGTSVINLNVLNEIHLILIDVKIDPVVFLIFIQDTSVKYNLDKMSIVYKYLNHLIYNFPDIVDSSFLKSIEIILHRQDIPIEIHLKYLINIIRERIYKQKYKLSIEQSQS